MTLPEKFAKFEQRYAELEGLLADARTISNQGEYQKFAKEYAGIAPIVTTLRAYREIQRQIEELQKLLKENPDHKFKEFAQS